MSSILYSYTNVGVNISERKSGTKRTKKREGMLAQIYVETTVTGAHNEMHTEAQAKSALVLTLL